MAGMSLIDRAEGRFCIHNITKSRGKKEAKSHKEEAVEKRQKRREVKK